MSFINRILFTAICLAAPLMARPLEVTEGAFSFRKELVGVHPRLMFTADDVKGFKERAAGTHKDFFEEMVRRYDTELNPAYRQGPPDTYAALRKMGEGALYGMGNWYLTGKALLYRVTGEKKYLKDCRKWLVTIAGYTKPPGDDLVAMDILTGVSITYDWLYNDLTEKERGKVRAYIHREVKRQLAYFDKDNYWTADWQNNHRWNRMQGMLSGIGAIYGDDPAYDMQPFGDAMVAQIEELLRWLPVDGGCHEGPGYWTYGHKFLIIALECFRSVTGREIFNEHEFFATSPRYRMYMTTPGWDGSFNFGDAGMGFSGFNSNLYLLASLHKDAYLQGWLQELRSRDLQRFFPPQWAFLWYDPSLQEADFHELPLWYYDADLELLTVRESWDDDASGFGFKCGYAGGRLLNLLRVTRTPGMKNWVNVAHDHPDQNHFLFFDGGTMLAEDDGYAHKVKATAHHNTLLVDGQGQAGAAGGWMAPYPEFRSGYVFDLCAADGCAYIAGDAGRAYDGIDRFERHAFYTGDYVVLVDGIRGDGALHDYELRVHSRGEWIREDAGAYLVKKKDAGMRMAVLSAPDGYAEALLPAGEEVGPCLAVRVKEAADAGFVTLYTGSKEPRDLSENARVLPLEGGAVVTVKDKEIDDLLAVRGATERLHGEGFDADAAMLLVRRAGQPLVMASEALAVTVDGTLLLEAKEPVRFVRTVRDNGVRVRLEPAFTQIELGQQEIRLGGFEAGKTYAVNGKDAVQADAEGVITVTCRLTAPEIRTFAVQ